MAHKAIFFGTRLLVLIPLLFTATSCTAETFPGEHWETMPPEAAGLNVLVLDQMRDFMQGRGCVIRHGKLVYAWGDPAERGDVASAAKPWYSFFLFKAIEEGLLPGVDVKASIYTPCLESLNPELGCKDRDILFRHLATQTSCYGVSENPGTAFDYNDWQMALFIETLFQGVYQAQFATLDSQVLHPLLTDILQCEDNPTFLAFGEGNRPGRLAVSPRDFCRFGYLYLHEGRWGKQTVLSAETVKRCTGEALPSAFPRTEAIAAAMCPSQWSLGSQNVPDDQCDHAGSYSWLWWVNGVNRDGKRHWPDAPADVFAALGHRNGMRGMAVIPSLDIVVSWNDTAIGDMPEEPEPLNTVFRLLREATATSPMPGQVIMGPQRRDRIVCNKDKNLDGNLDPFHICGPGDPEDFLYRGALQPDGTRNGDQQDIIEKMKGTGANCIYIQAIRSHGGDGDATHNPFVGNNPENGLNEHVLQQWETWFRQLDDSGILIFFIFYDDNASIWDTGDTVGTAEQSFIEQVVKRFEHHKHLIWCIAEEYGERFSAKRVSNMAGVIRRADKHQHAIAVHKNNSLSFSEFADDPDIDIFAAQWNVPTAEELHDGMITARKEAGDRYGVMMSEAENFGFGVTAREKFWACAMAGVPAMALGWTFDSSDAPSREDLETCGTLVRFFDDVDFSNMMPDDALGFDAARYVLANPGVEYLLYSNDSKRALGLDFLPEGVYTLSWFEITTGKKILHGSYTCPGGRQSWYTPRRFQGPVALHIKML